MQNLFDLLTSYAFVGILALGLLVVLIAGGIDISFTATASVAQYVALAVANAYGANWISVFAIAIGIGGALGALNAIFIQKLRIPSIIVSIATLNIFYGLLIFFTGGKYIYSLPDWFATGIFWFEFDWGKDTLLRRQPADPRACASAFSSPGCCSTAPISAGRSTPWAAIPTPRSGSASTFSASTCWSIATWASWPASPRWSRRSSRSRSRRRCWSARSSTWLRPSCSAAPA